MPEEYEKCLVGLTAIQREAWSTSQQAEDRREKGSSSSDSLECDDNLDCIESSHLLLNNNKLLEVNSRILTSIVNDISQNFSQTITVEQKNTTGQRILAGITIDWRHVEDWKSFKVESEPHLKLIRKKQRNIC